MLNFFPEVLKNAEWVPIDEKRDVEFEYDEWFGLKQTWECGHRTHTVS